MLSEKQYAEIVLNLDKTEEERIQAAFHLEDALEDESLQALVKGLFSDPSPIVRHEFAFSLGETSHPEIAGPALKKAVEEDDNIFVRHEAILALATLGRPEFKEFIERYLDDPDIEMAESAKIALQRLENTGHQ